MVSSVLVFVVAGVLLLAGPLVVLLVWAAMRESRARAELRDEALQEPVLARMNEKR